MVDLRFFPPATAPVELKALESVPVLDRADTDPGDRDFFLRPEEIVILDAAAATEVIGDLFSNESADGTSGTREKKDPGPAARRVALFVRRWDGRLMLVRRAGDEDNDGGTGQKDNHIYLSARQNDARQGIAECASFPKPKTTSFISTSTN